MKSVFASAALRRAYWSKYMSGADALAKGIGSGWSSMALTLKFPPLGSGSGSNGSVSSSSCMTRV